MATLVYCPTCNGVISSNATFCPHCGETVFTKREIVRRRRKCSCCDGTGRIQHEKSIYVSIDYAGKISFEKKKVGERWDETEYDSDGCPGVWMDVMEECDTPEIRDAKAALATGAYRIAKLPYNRDLWYNARLIYGYVSRLCSRCHGRGTEILQEEEFINLRKPVR